jgi:hypothetical protein
MRANQTILAFFIVSLTAGATPITWNLSGITFAGGGTASGSFTFDADTGTQACSTGLSPCGVFSNVNITTTTAGTVTGSTYTHICGVDVPGCLGVSPDSSEVLFLTSTSANQMGLPAIAFFFTGVGIFPPGGLSDAGGTWDVSNSSGLVGVVNEALCSNSTCSSPTTPSRLSNAGSVVSVSAIPEPSSALLLGVSLAGLALLRARRFLRGI